MRILAIISATVLFASAAFGNGLSTGPLPAMAQVEVFVVTVDANEDNPHVQKKDTKRLVGQLNKDGYINAIAGTQESLELEAEVPSFLLFVQWVVGPEGYSTIVVSAVFMDASNKPWRVGSYDLVEALTTTSDIKLARLDTIEIARDVLAPAIAEYWTLFLRVREEYLEQILGTTIDA